MVTLSLYYTAFGTVCYLYFGNAVLDTNPVVLDNLPKDQI